MQKQEEEALAVAVIAPDEEAATSVDAQNENSNPNFGCAPNSKTLAIIAALVFIGTGVLLGILLRPDSCHQIVIQSHNTKELWMDDIVAAFNKEKIEFYSEEEDTNMCLEARVCHTGSPRKDDPCGDGTKSHIWSPPNFVWVARDVLQKDSQKYVTSENQCTSTTYIPVGLAMWRTQAQALGWPEKEIGWKDIEKLVLDEEGWNSVTPNAPWGKRFLFGHGHPELSNSGSLSWVAAIYGWTNTPPDEPLTRELIFSQQVQDNTRNLTQAVAHMGKVDTDILDRMVANGNRYLHAVANYESNVIKYNLNKLKGNTDNFVMIYPKEGTFWQTEPLCVLDGTPANTNAFEQAAAKKFVEYAIREDQQAKLAKYGIRPHHISLDQAKAKIGEDVFTLENGVRPDVTTSSIPIIFTPKEEILQQVVQMWNENKKPVTWSMVLDVSGSMQNEGRIVKLKNAAKEFVIQMNDHDILNIYTFSDSVSEIVQPGSLRDIRNAAFDAIDALFPKGGTALHRAVKKAVEDMVQKKEANEENAFNYGIVVMTDGENNKELLPQDVYNILPDKSDPFSPHIFTIGFKDVPSEFMQRIAQDTNGKFFDTDGNDLDLLFQQIQAEL